MCTSTRARNSSGSTVSVPAVGPSDLSDRYVTAVAPRLKRPVGPQAVSATQLAEAVGVPQPTLSRWVRELRSVEAMPRRPRAGRTGAEKLRVVQDAANLDEAALGALLRREGLQMADLAAWRQAAEQALDAKPGRPKSGGAPEAKRVQDRSAAVCADVIAGHVPPARPVERLPRRTHARASHRIVGAVLWTEDRERIARRRQRGVPRVGPGRVAALGRAPLVALPHAPNRDECGHPRVRHGREVGLAVVAGVGRDHRVRGAQGRRRGDHGQEVLLLRAPPRAPARRR